MNETSAFVVRELARTMRDHELDRRAALDHLDQSLPDQLKSVSERVRHDLGPDPRPAGDADRASLRMAFRAMQLLRDHGGRSTVQLWTDLEHRQLTNASL